MGESRRERVLRGLQEHEAELGNLVGAETAEVELDAVPETADDPDDAPRGRLLAGLRQHEHARDAEPESLGPFSLIRELGRGGAGVVYVARHERLEREVALKVLRADGAGPEQLERFEIEARAAARLRHPGIVGVLEVGEEQGKPYLAMELIEGESLAERLRRDGPLEPRAAARIAHGLAEALAYAHARLVLHRDLKPGNVLLDGEGVPRLTDFGLAKEIGAESQGLTVTGQVMGTPVYMPPEQASGRMERVDARSDVYSLGATLYESLTGRPPYVGKAILEVLAQVRTDTSVPDVRSLKPGVDADLATIVGRTLEKDPDHRYQTAAALAQDLGRYLAHEPIEARPPGAVERGQKWLRRNRALARALGATLAAAAVLGALATAGFVSQLQTEQRRTAAQAEEAGRQAERADSEAEEAGRQATHAKRQAEVAQEALRLMIYEVRDQLTRVPGPRAAAARQAILSQALASLEELAAAAGEAGGATIPQAEAKRQIGELRLAGVGEDVAQGRQDLRDALALSREVRAARPDDPTTRQDLIQSLYVLGAALPSTRLDEAQALLQEAVSEAELLVEHDGAAHEETLRLAWRRHLALALERLGALHAEAGRETLALELYERALAERLQIDEAEDNPREQRPIAVLQRLVGTIQARLGNYVQALSHHDTSLALLKQVVDRDPSPRNRYEAARSYQLRGHAREQVRDDEGARADFTQALSLGLALRAEDPLDRRLLHGVVVTYAALARVTRDPTQEEARYQEGLRLTRELYALEPNLGGLRGELVGLLTGYGRFLARRGETYEGLKLLQEALPLAREARAAAPEDWSARWRLSELLHAIGQSRTVAEDYEGAAPLLEEAVALRREQTAEAGENAPAHKDLAASLMLLGDLRLQRAQHDAAVASYDEAQRILEGLLARNPDNPYWRGALAELHQRQARLARASGDETRAAKALDDALRIDEPDPDDLLKVRERISLLHRLAHQRLGTVERPATAAELAEASKLVDESVERSRALAARPTAERHDRRLAGRSESFAAEVALRRGQPEQAIPLFVAAAKRLRALVNARADDAETRRDLAICLERIGECHYAKGRWAEALGVYRDCLAERRTLLKDDPGSTFYRRDLGVVLAGVMNCCVGLEDLQGAIEAVSEAVESHRVLVRQAPRYQSELSVFEGALRQLQAQAGGTESPASNSPQDWLRQATAFVQQKRPLAAARAFREALADGEVARDLRQKALYNGACAAALAAQASEGKAREAFLVDAWTWLEDDLSRHARLLKRVEAKLAEEGLPPAHQGELKSMLRFCTSHFDHARQDPDLDLLRQDPERFAKAFPR